MRSPPRSLLPNPTGGTPAADGPWPPPPGPAGVAGRFATRLRATARTVLFFLLTGLSIPVQAVLLRLPGRAGRAKVAFARVYWRLTGRLFGVSVRVLGTEARQGLGTAGRPVVFVANHASWLDIAVLGGALHAPFVAKSQVGQWPLARTIARLGRTVYVSRRARDTGRERDDMRDRLAAGDDLILFPEGTSSDGNRVLPFRSAFFSVAESPSEGAAAASASVRPLVQPVSLVYDRDAGLPVGRASRALFAWYGDMELAPHVWAIAGRRGGARCTVMLHPPLDPAAFPSRKALAAAAWSAVAEGAAALRQGREAPRPAARGGHDRSA